MTINRQKSVDDVMYIIMTATSRAKPKKLSLDVLYAFADILVPDVKTNGKVSLNGKALQPEPKIIRARVRDLLRDQWEINRMFYEPVYTSHKREIANKIATEILNAAYPKGVKNVFYPGTGLNFGNEPIEGATNFYVELTPRSGKYSVWPQLYPTKEFGVVDMDVIPDEIKPFVEGAKKLYASSK